MLRRLTKKLLACVSALLIAVTGVGSMAFGGMPVRADSAGWFIPCRAYELISQANMKSWGWSSLVSITELPDGGGLQFVWSDAAVARRQAFEQSFALDGLKLRFSGLQNEQGTGAFAILLQDSMEQNLDPVSPEAGVLALIAVDTADGEIRYENDGIGLNANGAKRYLADGTVLLKDERLQAAHLAGKEFFVSFAADGNGGFTVATEVDGETISGSQSITKEMLADVTRLQNTEAVYVGLGPGRDNAGATTLNFTGITSKDYQPDVEPDDGQLWFEPSESLEIIPSSDIASWWGNGGHVIISDDPNGGGVRWQCKHNGVGMRQGWKQNFALDGLTLRFSGLQNPNQAASLLVYLSDDYRDGLDVNKDDCRSLVVLALDTVKGQLRFENDGATNVNGSVRIRQAGTVLLDDERLKYASLAGQHFQVRFAEGDAGCYTITVTVGNESITGVNVLTSDMLSGITHAKALDRMYVGIGNNNGNNGWTRVVITSLGPIQKMDIAGKELKENDIAGLNYWEDKLSCTEVPTGGLRYIFKNAFRNIRLGVNNPVSMDGLYIKLNNLTKNGDDYPKLAMILSQSQATSTADGMFCLLLDTAAGELRLVRSKELTGDEGTEDTILADERLYYGALMGRTVVLRTAQKPDGDWQLTVQVGNDPAMTATLTAAQLAQSTAFDPTADGYLTLTPGIPQDGTSAQSFSVDLVECWSTVTHAADVLTKDAVQAKVPSADNVSALRFKFQIACSGVGYADDTHENGNYQRVMTDARLKANGTTYTLVDFGAIVSLENHADLTFHTLHLGKTFQVPAENLYMVEVDGTVTYTAMVTGISGTHFEDVIYARPYAICTDGKIQRIIYGDTVSACVQDTITIDNSALLPAYVPDSQMTTDANGTPDWIKTAIIGEVNLNTATEEGTLEASVQVLDHYAEMGVNCIWVAPVYDPGTSDYPNGYVNLGVQTINPRLTGTGTDYEAGWKKMAWFVEEAHKRNIRILLDVSSWGLRADSPLLTEHPEFAGEENGSGSYYYDWANSDFREWYISTVVNIGLTTGCDGFRYDTEPGYAGYEVDGEIRTRLLAAGRKLLMMSERENERKGVYDIGQSGMTEGVSYDTYKAESPVYFWLDKYNIVDSIQSGAHYGTQASQDEGRGGQYHYYTFCITNHDYNHTVVNGNRAAVGYQAVYTPFIPVMLLGEEWGNPQHNTNSQNAALYFNKVDWSLLEQPEGRALYEDIKAMIRIRRTYTDVFVYYPAQFKDANICKVSATGLNVQAYARYSDTEAVLVIPNKTASACTTTVTLPSELFSTNHGTLTVMDGESGKAVAQIAAGSNTVQISVPARNQRVLVISRR